MQGSDQDTPQIPPVPSFRNAFHPDFLKRLGERDEPVTADVAGPWLVGRSQERPTLEVLDTLLTY